MSSRQRQEKENDENEEELMKKQHQLSEKVNELSNLFPLPPVVLPVSPPQHYKIKAIVKPGGNFLALSPENVVINSKCTVGRVLRVVSKKIKEQSEKEKAARGGGGGGWFCSFGGGSSSQPRLVSPADSIFLKINDVFMPKHDSLVTEFMSSPDEEVKIFYFVEETFG